MENVPLIGYGAMGRTIVRALENQTAQQVTCVLEMPAQRAAVQAELGPGVRVVTSIEELHEQPDCAPHCAIECAGHEAVKRHVPSLLRRGIDVIMVSVGSLSEPGLLQMLEAAAQEGKAQLTLVLGAVPGIDALAAAQPFGPEKVTYIGRKPPLGWRSTPAERVVDLGSLAAPATIFEGSAREAARTYPKNANVAATIALAGLGLDRTRVQLIADPGITRNIHSLKVEGAFGELEIAGGEWFGLAAGIWTRDYKRAWRLARRLETGTVWINTYKQLSISTPFTGIKDSGMGVEKGRLGIAQYAYPKSLYWGLNEQPLPWAG